MKRRVRWPWSASTRYRGAEFVLSAGAAATAVATVIVTAATPGFGKDAFDLSRHSIPPELIFSGGPPKDGIPAISRPHFVTAAAARFLRDDDRVVGIAGPSGAKAYPLRVLNWHEIVNDVYGDRPIAVTYCPLTASAVVFDRRVRGEVLSFGVSGKLYESNVLMYDHQSQSLWSQLAAEAVTGPRLGQRLATLPAQLVTWRAWRTSHPETEVLSVDTGFTRDYHNDPYASYAASPALMFPPSRRDSRMEAKALLLGVSIGREHKAYPLAELRVLGGKLRDRIGDSEVEIGPVSRDGRSAITYSGNPSVRTTRVYWFAWAAFHPDTAIWHLPSVGADADVTASPAAKTDDVDIVETRSYWSGITGPFVLEPDRDPFSRNGLFVVSGTIKNKSGHPIHHVRLRFDLIDGAGHVVYREEGYNRSAEAMIELESPMPARGNPSESVVPIPASGTDSYRMIFIGEEIPRFDHPSVSIVSVD